MIDFKAILSKIPIIDMIPFLANSFNALTPEQKQMLANALLKLAVKAAESYLKK